MLQQAPHGKRSEGHWWKTLDSNKHLLKRSANGMVRNSQRWGLMLSSWFHGSNCWLCVFGRSAPNIWCSLELLPEITAAKESGLGCITSKYEDRTILLMLKKWKRHSVYHATSELLRNEVGRTAPIKINPKTHFECLWNPEHDATCCCAMNLRKHGWYSFLFSVALVPSLLTCRTSNVSQRGNTKVMQRARFAQRGHTKTCNGNLQMSTFFVIRQLIYTMTVSKVMDNKCR